MEEEFKKIGIELAKLAKKYNQDYLDLGYVNNCVVGNNDPEKEEHISIYIKEEKLRKCLQEKIEK